MLGLPIIGRSSVCVGASVLALVVVSDNVLCREAALGFGQRVSSRRQIADVGSKLIQMVSTVNGIAPSHSKHRIQRR